MEEELHHRSTQRAHKLLARVKESLETDEAPPVPAKMTAAPVRLPVTQVQPAAVPEPLHFDKDTSIDWKAILSDISDNHSDVNTPPLARPLKNDPEDILDTWTVLEALSPQSYKKPDNLIIGNGSVAYLRKGQEPWIKGEKSRPRANLYYLVYLGAINLEQATENLLKQYQDNRVERPSARGFATLGVVMLDQKGIPVPETGLALSSFGWAYARALQGNLQDLKYWDKAEKVLKEELQKMVFQTDEDGTPLPFSLARAEGVFNWLAGNCCIPEKDIVPPSFAIRLYQPFSKGEPEAPLLNSFFLDDLQRVKAAVKAKSTGKALSQYLGIIKPEHRYDILQNKNLIEIALQPKNTPPSRWPGKGRHPLVLLQQTAVNMAMQELKDNGLFSVNGPPGTGKTTLLRDIAAAVVVNRAKAMSDFKNPEEAFTHSGQMKLGSSFVHLYKLHDSLRGHEMVVASTNNNAVENVSKELPLCQQIAEELGDLNYFKTVSDALSESGEETWGVIAAVLGNAANKGNFINKAWWDDNSGLKNYFLSITGQIDLKPDEDGHVHIPKVIEECNPPKDLSEAKLRWAIARQHFIEAMEKSEKAIEKAQQAYESLIRAFQVETEISEIIEQQAEQQGIIEKLAANAYVLERQDSVKASEVEEAKTKISECLKIKPGFFKRLFARRLWKQWASNYQLLRAKLKTIQKDFFEIQIQHEKSQKLLENAQRKLSELTSKKEALERDLAVKMAIVRGAANICGDKLITPELWQKSHEDQQVFSPNFTMETQRFRDDVFVAAMALHKAFIDVSAKQLRKNLGAFFYVLSGGGLPQDKQFLLPHLWSSLFLLTPVISTAFASVGRMLKDLPAESLGWLLIDEAGQATPQAAIGAVYRAKRVVSVGDPLQIEPVVTLPPPLVEGISKFLGVDPDHWMAPAASVQSVSDNANSYGTTIPRDLSEIRIGTPLLVHRRCENPMFRISNILAYAGLMVQATVSKPSDITDIFGAQVRWFDVSGSAQEKWCQEEGELVADMLLRACSAVRGDPDIFVITPFRVVAERMRRRMMQDSETLASLGIDDPNVWIGNNIGTVHTFQGKEAKAVILLLGAPDAAQNGARNWATSNVNLLNVAVSRAKQNFYVVGNRSLWGDLGNMKIVSRYLGLDNN